LLYIRQIEMERTVFYHTSKRHCNLFLKPQT
jgi:hypothetical protein